ncbi:MAG: hypothetical protein ABW128_16905 [Rhizorhabdus sp.]
MTFKIFAEAVQAKYNNLAKRELFTVDTEDLFTTYLLAFPEGTDPIFRVRTVHDCNADKNFIRRLGGLVAIYDDGHRESVWTAMDDMPYPYNVVARHLNDIVLQAPIKGVFRSKERVYGSEPNWDNHDTKIRWEHFFGRVADRHFAHDPATKRGERDTIAQVLRRGLDEIRFEDMNTVLDLIDAKALYRGEEHKAALQGFSNLMLDYRKAADREAFVWSNLDNRNARFRNTVIGTLLVDLSEGVELDKAVRMFEAKVAPANYKRPTALITPKMIEQAVAKLDELGLEGAIHRRFATIEDVSVNDVLFVDNAVRSKMKDGLTDLLMGAVKPQTVDIARAEPISIEDFLKLDLTSVDAVIKNAQVGNFVSLTGGDGPEKLFKWNNNFAWSYDGEVADSIKQRVKAAGGNVTNAKLRVSLAWSNGDDLDIHCRTPNGQHIYFGSPSGVLDVDMNAGGRMNSKDPVENLSWRQVTDGVYRITVNNYTRRSSENVGFTLEVESGGKLQQFRHDKGLGSGATSAALILTVKNGLVVKIDVPHDYVGGTQSIDKWGVSTETLVPVDTIMTSPNHWEGAGSVGNKHWFFILKGCKNPDAVRGIYNEFLRSDLDAHRKVFEVLGAKTKCQPTDNQLSGVGFSSTRSDELTVVVNKRRAYIIKF